MKVIDGSGAPVPAMRVMLTASAEFVRLCVVPSEVVIQLDKDDLHQLLDMIHQIRESTVFVRIAD